MFASKPTWSQIAQQKNRHPKNVGGAADPEKPKQKVSSVPQRSRQTKQHNEQITNSVESSDWTPNGSGTDYAQKQRDEIDALRSIYMEDFEEAATKPAAWNKNGDHVFRLRLKASSDPETSVYLHVTMPATYPKTIPNLSISGTEGLRKGVRTSIKNLVKTKPKTLLGNEMIYDVASAIQELLEEAADAKAREGPIPSLENERASHAAALRQEAQQQKEEIARQKEVKSAEEERVLANLVEKEVKRRQENAKRLRRSTDANDSESIKEEDVLVNALSLSRNGDANIRPPGITKFERPIIYTAPNGHEVFRFRFVFDVSTIAEIRNSTITLVQPLRFMTTKFCPLLVLRHCEVPGDISAPSGSEVNSKVRKLEVELEKLKSLRHPNTLNLLDFKITRFPAKGPIEACESWGLYFLTEHAEEGSLRKLLDVVGPDPLSPVKVKSWMIQLLDATDFYHRNGFVHKSIHLGNILLSRGQSSKGEIVVKLADIYQFDISQMTCSSMNSVPVRSAYWVPPELCRQNGTKTAQTDIWDLGLVLLQMALGSKILQTYTSPTSLIGSLDLSDSFESMVREMLKTDPKKRPSAFDLLPVEFLRNDDPPLSETPQRPGSISGTLPRSRHNSFPIGTNPSRYTSDFVEAGRLGKGGFGEVVKARNKLDGRFYAVKKITEKSKSALADVLSEIMLLSRLNHPYVVRYFTAWIEEDFNQAGTGFNSEVAIMTATEGSYSTSDDDDDELELEQNTAGLDFISSAGYPQIEFGYDSDEEKSSDTDDEDSSSEPNSSSLPSRGGKGLRRPRVRKSQSSVEGPAKSTTLYIQMEYCEKKTMRDLIHQGLYENIDEGWRLFRQILEGLSHIHSHGIIHRDLKPENIFIDVGNTPRIGDFGLATMGHFNTSDKSSSMGIGGGLTHSIGTTFYVAPEIRSSSGIQYNQKVDMYSLGIIFFEMCYPLKTAMERDQVLRQLREKQHKLPPEFSSNEKLVQGEIIMSLLSHKPSERPNCAELLRSGKIPVQIEDETLRLAVEGLSNPDSPYYQKMMSAVFEQPLAKVQDFAWDAKSFHKPQPNELHLHGLVKDKLISIFRHHGAVQSRRQMLFPRSQHYPTNLVKLLDSSGTLVQLPYDLTLPHARAIAKGKAMSEKSYAFGSVFRESLTGCEPRSHREVDFDIVSDDTLDLALKEAEVIKVLDEIISAFPSLRSTPMCFHINHSDLLGIVMDFCRISSKQRPVVKEILSKLNVGQWTWQKIRNELRGPSVGVASTSLDDLTRFDFRERVDKAHQKLLQIFDDPEYASRLDRVFSHLNTVCTYLKHMGVKRKIYVYPLSGFNEKFYRGSFIFQCLTDTKKREVFAAGGRYDSLVREFQSHTTGKRNEYHAVGFNLGWDKLCTSMNRYMKTPPNKFWKKSEIEVQGSWAAKRCDVLVASLDPNLLRTAGVEVVQELWKHDITAELAVDASSHEELVSHYKEDPHNWLVILRHDPSTNMIDRTLKVKTMTDRSPDIDVRLSELVSWLRAEIRARDQREAVAQFRSTRKLSIGDPAAAPGDRDVDVRVLQAQHRSKKINRRNIVEAAQQKSQELTQSFLSGPIAAIETTDRVLEAIRDTRLSDPESWRKVIQDAPLVDRKYLGQVHELLGDLANEMKGTARNAFIYNFKTGSCIYYDLGPCKT